jgi:hypothetical protein
LDLGSGAVTADVPFDVPILFRAALPDSARRVSIVVGSDTLQWTRLAGTGPDSIGLLHEEGFSAGSLQEIKVSLKRGLTSAERTAFEGRVRTRIQGIVDEVASGALPPEDANDRCETAVKAAVDAVANVHIARLRICPPSSDLAPG